MGGMQETNGTNFVPQISLYKILKVGVTVPFSPSPKKLYRLVLEVHAFYPGNATTTTITHMSGSKGNRWHLKKKNQKTVTCSIDNHIYVNGQCRGFYRKYVAWTFFSWWYISISIYIPVSI
jgi:hypothetical protein